MEQRTIIRRFNARGVENAEIFLTGLGYFETKINGQKITEERYIPVVSDYEKRNTGEFLYPIYDELTNRIYYCTYDITKLNGIQGADAFAVWCGVNDGETVKKIAEFYNL